MAMRSAVVLSAVGLLGAEAALPAMPLTTGAWTKITPNGKDITGSITIRQVNVAEDKHHADVKLDGLPNDCPAQASAACKIVIETASECKADGTGSTPLTNEYKIANGAENNAKLEPSAPIEVTVNAANKLANLKTGKVVRIYDTSDSNPIACAPLKEFKGGDKQAGAITLAKVADATTKGKAALTWDKAKQVIQLELENGDTGCDAANTAECNVLVSSATKCDAKADDLKKAYKESLKARYTVDSDKKAAFSTPILTATEKEMDAVYGKVLVATDKSGKAVACGAIVNPDAKASGAARVVAGPFAALLAALAAYRA